MRKLVTGLSVWAIASKSAFAESIGQPQQSSLPSFLMLGALLLVFYFMLIRPQMRRTKEQRELMNSLEKGDEVMTSSGIYGKISKMEESTITLTIANGVDIKIQKQAIANMLPKGSVTEA